MNATFCSLEWKKREPEFLEKKPSGFCKEIKRQGKTVYMIPPGNMYILTVKTDDGKTHEIDVYGVIKYYAPTTLRITKKFREDFEKYMSNQKYSVDKVVGIAGIYPAIEKYFSR